MALKGKKEIYIIGKKVIVNSILSSYIKEIKETGNNIIIFNKIYKLMNDPKLKEDLFEPLCSLQENQNWYNEKGEEID